MACLRTLAQTSALVALATTTLAAQAAHGRIVASPGGHPRIASIAPPPPPPRPLNYQLGETVFSSVPVIITPEDEFSSISAMGTSRLLATALTRMATDARATVIPSRR